MNPNKRSLRQRVADGSNPQGGEADSQSSMDQRSSNSFGGSGIRKKLKADTTAASSSASGVASEGPAALHQLLKHDWASGKIPSWKIQEYAQAAIDSGATGLEQLQTIGASGKYKNNAQRDLMRAFGRPLGAPSFYKASIPMNDGDGNVKIVEHPFLLPHQMFAQLHRERKDKFQQCVVGDNSERMGLWAELRAHPIVDKHPTLNKDSLENVVPIGIHGDAAAFSHQDGLFILTWNSLVGQGTSKESRFVMTLFKKSELLPDGSTLNAIFRVISWSLNAMLAGKTPEVDEQGCQLNGGGQVLAGRWSAATIQVRGDWQFYSQAFGFPTWRSNDNCCWLCKASNINPNLLWTDFNDSAAWRETVWDHEGYCQHLVQNSMELPELFSVVGLRIETIMVDVLHAVDLGVASHILGNIFVEVLPSLGRNQAAQLKELNRRIKAWYRQEDIASRLQGPLTLDKIKKGTQEPKLKAKAAATRNLAPFAKALSQEFCSGTLHDRRRTALADCLVRFYGILKQDRTIDARGKAELPRLGRDLCCLYAFLHAEAKEVGMRTWKLVPKFHIFQHLCQTQAVKLGNPRFYWTYPDEDLVGQLSEVARTCHPSTMPFVALYKYLVVVFG